ncbi:hypothetical protein [Nitrospira sp. BLG_1]|uniref:hypothetical protein n=1 Tax=Nitrospira sp. BLG_1 TaxID=3395883 RepID=UPI0039BD80AE
MAAPDKEGLDRAKSREDNSNRPGMSGSPWDKKTGPAVGRASGNATSGGGINGKARGLGK